MVVRVEGLGREEHVRAELLRARGVVGLGARVGDEVVGVVELRRVDEEGDDDDVVDLAGGGDQRLVAGVEGAHGRYEADRAALLAHVVQEGAELVGGAERPHAADSSCVASARASKRGRRSGVRSTTAARWRSTVSVSPRAIGPVRAASAPSSAQFSTAARTSGTSRARSTPAVAARRSAAPSSGGEEVRGDRGGRVVGGSVCVGDGGRRSCSSVAASARGGLLGAVGGAGDGAACSREARRVGRHRQQRVQAERLVRREDLEAGRARAVADEEAGRGVIAAAAERDLGVGDAEQHDVGGPDGSAPRPSGPCARARGSTRCPGGQRPRWRHGRFP